MTTPRHHAPDAFTLLEVVIALSLFSVMVLALLRFFVSYNTSYGFQRIQVSTAHSASVLMDEITHAVLPADQVLASHTFAGISRTSSASVLVLELPAIDATGAVVASAYDYVAFYADGARVYEAVEADAASSRKTRTRLLSDTITSISFTYDNVSFPSVTLVAVDLVSSAMYKTQSTTSHLHESISLRNLSEP